MALTQITTSGLANGAVTSSKISNTVQLGGPTISQIQITDSSYNVLDDTAVSTSGGYIKITGTGFAAGAIVVIGSVNATSTGFVSSTVLNVQVPALSAGTYTVYVVNSNGGTAIGVNGLTYSAEPNWVTGSTLPNGLNGSPISIQLDATDATTYTLQDGSTLPTGLTLTSGGLLSGTVSVGIETVYSFTVVATDAELQDSPRAFTITITVGDTYFYLTTLLLPGNGTNNGTNNTFLDSSTNNLTVTRNGNTTQGTYTPYSLTGWSNFFDGSSDWLQISNNAALDFATGDYTLEMWVNFRRNPTSWENGMVLLSKGNDQNGGWAISYGVDGAAPGGFSISINSNASSQIKASFASTPVVGTWYHVAFTRSGTSGKAFINGVEAGTRTGTDYPSASSNDLRIGRMQRDDYPYWTDGYISNLRLVKGTALYTANFTPPTSALTAVEGTTLLTCQSNRFIDNSTNNFTISKNGDVSVQSFSPFVPGSSYSTTTVGGSAYFDGSGDYLSLAGNAVFGFGTGDFAIEMWFYRTSTSGTATLYDSRASDGVVVELQADGGIGIYRNLAGNNVQSAPAGSYKFQTWHHFVTTRVSNQWRTFIDGVSVAGPTSDSNNLGSSNNVNIGMGISGSSNPFTGYISSLRVLKGTGYSTVTVPTAPYTNIANTSLLLNFTNGQIIDATSKNDLETVGNARISTVQSKWGGSSMYFDGTGDYLVANNTSRLLSLGTADFTVEAWIYMTTLPSGNGYPSSYWIVGGGPVNSDTGFDIAIGSTNLQIGLTNFASLNINVGHGMSATTWYHIAVSRSGSTLYAFKDGVQLASASVSGVTVDPCLTGLSISAAEPVGATGGNFNGYINDLRITKGYARYTTNFTPPSSAFPTL